MTTPGFPRCCTILLLLLAACSCTARREAAVPPAGQFTLLQAPASLPQKDTSALYSGSVAAVLYTETKVDEQRKEPASFTPGETKKPRAEKVLRIKQRFASEWVKAQEDPLRYIARTAHKGGQSAKLQLKHILFFVVVGILITTFAVLFYQRKSNLDTVYFIAMGAILVVAVLFIVFSTHDIY